GMPAFAGKDDLGRLRSMRAVAPTDSEGVVLGNGSLAGHAGGYGGLQEFGRGGELRPKIHTAEPGINADPLRFVREKPESFLERFFVERRQLGRGRRRTKVRHFN